MPVRQLLPFGLDDAPSGSVNQYQSITGNGEVAAWTSTENEVQMCVPTAGKFTNLYMKGSLAAGVGKSRNVILRKNGADTSLLLNFGATDTVKYSLVKESVVAGDLVSFVSVPTGSPANALYYGSIEFWPDDPNESILMGGTGDVSLGNTLRYLCPHALANGATAESDVWTVIANYRGGQYGTITKFQVALSAAPTGTQSRTFEIRKNGAGTGITVTITGTATTGSATGSVTVSDGDYLTIGATASGSAASSKAYYGIVIEPDSVGEYLIPGVSGGSLSTTGASYEYNFVSCGNAAWGAVKGDKAQGGQWGHFVRSIGMKLSRSPSTVADTKAYELYLENPASIGLRAYVEGLATYANSGEQIVGSKGFGSSNTWNTRTLGFNSPRVATAGWTMQMRYL